MNHYLEEFCRTTEELLGSDAVRMMGRWKHHGHISTLDHSLFVAYCSYRAARALRLDETAAARAGLLHDLYLYDSRDTSAHPGWQCFDHPRAAARNAAELTALSEKERNIILSHMWPLGGQLPRSWEAWLVDLVDTLCAGLELAHIYHPGRLRERLGVLFTIFLYRGWATRSAMATTTVLSILSETTRPTLVLREEVLFSIFYSSS